MSLGLGKLGWVALAGRSLWTLTAPDNYKCKTYCKQNLDIQTSSSQPSLSNIGNNGSYSNGCPTPLPIIETADVHNPNSATGLSEVHGHATKNCPVEQLNITETTDVYDANSPLLSTGELRILLPLFRSFGKRQAFSGQVVTVKSFEDNAIVVETLLETNADGVPLGIGKVLVIDGGGSLRRSMVGSVLTKMAHKMGWTGIVVNGCIRDIDEINSIDIGIRSLGSVPVRSTKKGGGERHVPVQFAGVLIRNGDWLCADSTGILVADRELSVLGPTHQPVHRVTPEGASVYTHLMADYTSPVEPHRLFEAHCLDDHNFMPKFLPESFRSIEYVCGGAPAVGSVKRVNFAKGRPFKCTTYRVDELDVDKLNIKYTIIEGDILEDKWDSIVYEINIRPSTTGSHFTMIGYYHAKKKAVTTEYDVKVHREGLKNNHKAIQEFLLLYPTLYT